MPQNTRQNDFLVSLHDAVNFWELSKKSERGKLLGLASSFLLILDGKHKNHKYRLLDRDGKVISGDLYENFDEANPYEALREILNL